MTASKKALIAGVTGQDGAYLARHLLGQGYRVVGTSRDSQACNTSRLERLGILQDLELLSLAPNDFRSVLKTLTVTAPEEIYNLAAISFVGMSFAQPEHTANVTGLGALRLLEAVRICGIQESVKIYQASSSEMFGKVQQTPQNEKTPFYPRSPYGAAKAFAHHCCVNYREAYKMHISCGILFNHESEKRGIEFVTRKITNGVAKIKLGLASELRLGDLTPKRDWGFAGDYVDAMWRMLQQNEPSDFVIATGETHSVQEFVDLAFKYADLEGQQDKYIVKDERFMRPSEVDVLIGDSSKAKRELNWSPKVNFNQLVERMVTKDIEFESSKLR